LLEGVTDMVTLEIPLIPLLSDTNRERTVTIRGGLQPVSTVMGRAEAKGVRVSVPVRKADLASGLRLLFSGGDVEQISNVAPSIADHRSVSVWIGSITIQAC
jgi:hypothetical protein